MKAVLEAWSETVDRILQRYLGICIAHVEMSMILNQIQLGY